MKLIYPAIFSKLDEQDGYCVTFPDLPGCVTQGASLSEAIENAQDAASGWVLDELEDGNPIPPASRPDAVSAPKGGFVSLLALDMDSYAEKYGDKAVRKNLTIPAWLNTIAEERHVNFSGILKDALISHLDLR